jgi:hypothetical protein
MNNALAHGHQLHQAVDADIRWARQQLMAAEVNPLRRVAFGKRDAALARMVAKTIHDSMPPVLLRWSPKLQQILHDHHLHPVALALQEDHLTPRPHHHTLFTPDQEPSHD